ncbi:isoprenylcysteine carboxylmethyltransferase family protein [Alcaligenes faecalis subsp. phenolicus]|uniref:Isoprenylcysteine carboxylmethyltransferase family protein n=1 Tax=Alcaligenes phenolicus TaxID=232846 RepID=A0AAW5W0H6_9BURK|nr:isoprenylcysteine carboxylmethyltransferase family protein [Alcaligenes phenolicus]MCX5565809.1 isoprenylcysteine carboxylmethyltransferase family protein [Alcaligenes phenolicus]
MKRLELLIPPPLVMLIIGLIMWLLYELFPALTFAWIQHAVAAASIGMLGFIISLVGVVSFRRADTTIDPSKPSQASALVSSGVYRYSRNPMYLGVLLMLVGWAIYLGNVLSIFCTPVFIAYITRFQIMPEERLLQEKFGAAFLSYKNSVRRWL